MNLQQMNEAQKAMVGWLSHPQELGKAPTKIECAGEFDLHDLHYYIFKYKKSFLGPWLLGVCGGYEDDGLEHCGHIFSNMEPYEEATAAQKAADMVEMIRSYWMEQAKKAEERKENPGSFVSFVLLEKPEWDKAAILRDLKERWQIEDEPEDEPEGEDEEDLEERDDSIVLNYHGAILAISLMPGPIPDGEAEANAEKNYRWSEAVATTKRHQAHLLVAVLGKQLPPVEAGTLLVKLLVTCCNQTAGVLGIYTNETVYQPEYYLYFSGMLDDDLFPIYNLVWFGLYHGKNGICGYTCGMRNFGYDEIEVLDSKAAPQDLSSFLADVAAYVITENVLLNDGETIGFSEEQKLPITKSKGAAVEGNSIKIQF